MTDWGTSANRTSGQDETFVVEDSEAGSTSVLSNAARSPDQHNEPIMADDPTPAPATAQADQIKGNIATRACLSCRRLKVSLRLDTFQSRVTLTMNR